MAFLLVLCCPSHFQYLVSTVATSHIPITVKYNFSFSFQQFTILNCEILFPLCLYFPLLNGEIELTKNG